MGSNMPNWEYGFYSSQLRMVLYMLIVKGGLNGVLHQGGGTQKEGGGMWGGFFFCLDVFVDLLTLWGSFTVFWCKHWRII